MSRAWLVMTRAQAVVEMATVAHYKETEGNYYDIEMDKAFLKLAETLGYEVKRIVPAVTSAPGFDGRQVGPDDRETDLVLR